MEIQVGELIKKAKVSRCGNGDYPVLSMTMHDGLMFQNDRFKKQIASVDQSNYQVVKRHQLVESFPIDEGVLAVQELTEEGIVSPAYKIWDVNMDRVIPVYLELALRSPRSIEYYKSKLRGTTARRRSITDAEFCAMQIKLPGLKEQERIIELISRARTISAKRQQELDTLDELIKARFVELFDNGNYPKIRLGDACKKITDGTHKTPNYIDEGITFISAKNIVNGELDFSDVKHISEEEYQEIQKRCQTEKNDILLSKSGSLGAPVIVRTEEKLGLFESLAVLKYERDRFLPEFLCEQLKTDMIQRQFTTGTKGVAIKHLHLGVIADTEIIEPPVKEQKAFADFVKQVDKSKVAVQRALEETQTLFDSLMQEYFG